MLANNTSFFVELSVFEDSLITEKPSLVAFAAILNALELENNVEECEKSALIETIAATLSIDIHSQNVKTVQCKLYEAYFRTEQSKFDSPFEESSTQIESEEIDSQLTGINLSSSRSAFSRFVGNKQL